MRKFYFLFLITMLGFPITYAQDCNIGNSVATEDFTAGSFAGNFLLGVKYTLAQEGVLNSINLLGNNTGNNVQMAVYDDSAGVPNNLIASSEVATIGNGIISLPVTPTLLPAGDYWIMAVYDVQGNHSNMNLAATGNKVYATSLVFGSSIPTNASEFIWYIGQDFLYFLEIECGISSATDDFEFTDNITLFPNPSSDFIQFYGISKKENYTLYDNLGKKILEGAVENGERMSIQDLKVGLYFFRFENGTEIKFLKK